MRSRPCSTGLEFAEFGEGGLGLFAGGAVEGEAGGFGGGVGAGGEFEVGAGGPGLGFDQVGVVGGDADVDGVAEGSAGDCFDGGFVQVEVGEFGGFDDLTEADKPFHLHGELVGGGVVVGGVGIDEKALEDGGLFGGGGGGGKGAGGAGGEEEGDEEGDGGVHGEGGTVGKMEGGSMEMWGGSLRGRGTVGRVVEVMATAFGIPPGGPAEGPGRFGGATTGYRVDPLRGIGARLTGASGCQTTGSSHSRLGGRGRVIGPELGG